MNPAATIRSAVPGDLPGLPALCRAFPANPVLDDDTDAANWRQMLSTSGLTVLVAEIAGLLAVFAASCALFVTPTRPWSTPCRLARRFALPMGTSSRPAPPGQAARYDSEYVRHGTANLFMAFEPLGGWRGVQVTERRQRGDWAHFVRDLVDGRYKDADKVVLVMDQLNIHSPASLYEAFPPAEARRVADKLEIHHTPKHGSWLNMAEIELSVFRRDLPERVAGKTTLERHVAAWQHRRNAAATKADWRFTTDDARIKLRKLYPSV